MPNLPAYDVVILGAGAAGLMCAIEAGNRGKRVLLIEHNDAVGKKIRISGGGRSNFTNLYAEPKRYVSSNPRFAHSAFSRYTPQDFIRFVEKHGIAYHEKKLGQLFCDGSAQALIDALVDECKAARVETRLGCRVLGVTKPDQFAVETSQGEFHAKALVVATGGLSIPKLGATDFGYRLAKQFDIPIVPCTPGLVPFTLSGEIHEMLHDLSGLSFDAKVTIDKTTFDESVLITHRGLSGPAILQISSYWTPGDRLSINLFPNANIEHVLFNLKQRARTLLPRPYLAQSLPSRFAYRLCEVNGWDRPFGETTDKALRGMAEQLRAWRLTPAGTEGYAKAEVTRGGVDTRALDPKTMEVRSIPGLYFIGEVVDVTGWLGGYNFQWAWASAYCAGNAIV